MLTFICPLTSVIIFFSKAYGMPCFHTEYSDWDKYLPGKLFPVFQNWAILVCLSKCGKLHTTFVSLSKFDAEKKEGNNGNCKAFCVTSKRKKFVLKLSSSIKWEVIISSSLRMLLKVWIWYKYQNSLQNYYHHDGEQLGFYKKFISKHTGSAKRRMFLKSLYCKKQRNPIYLKKTALNTTPNAMFNMKKVNLEES